MMASAAIALPKTYLFIALILSNHGRRCAPLGKATGGIPLFIPDDEEKLFRP
jgi:hypothetical protein